MQILGLFDYKNTGITNKKIKNKIKKRFHFSEQKSNFYLN